MCFNTTTRAPPPSPSTTHPYQLIMFEPWWVQNKEWDIDNKIREEFHILTTLTCLELTCRRGGVGKRLSILSVAGVLVNQSAHAVQFKKEFKFRSYDISNITVDYIFIS